MVQIKLTKTELRAQQVKLGQLQKYLPTLQLKKALLQLEVSQVCAEIEQLESQVTAQHESVLKFSSLFSQRNSLDFLSSISVVHVQVAYENIAGVEIPIFQDVVFAPAEYSLFDTSVWYESAGDEVKQLVRLQEQVKIVEKKKKALEQELQEVSIRVNLFEKIMIPRAKESIKKIKIFLGDQQLAAIAQAKVAKKKILSKAGQP